MSAVVAWGLIWQVVSPEELEAESARVADKLAALQPDVASPFKRALNEVGLLHQFNRVIDIENEAQRALGGQG